MSKFNRGVLFFLFFFSGFASLVYQVVWTRMAFMSFGIIVPVLSVVLSVFMLGLALGSWLGGKCIGPMVRKFGISAAFFYGGAEGIIGLGAFAVPHLFAFGAHVLLGTGEMNSFSYLLMSALALAIAIFPWCVCMGTTFPFMMAYVREIESSNVESFSFLYLANVLGAMWGTFYTAVVLVESLGFHHTLWVAAAANFFITFISLCLALERPKQTAIPATAINAEPSPGAMVDGAGPVKTVLFTTGFAAMAMEVVWSRAFTPQLKTQVYSFAMIVFAYLGATFVGSWLYRSHLRSRKVIGKSSLMGLLAISAFLPVICDDLRFVPANFQTSAWHVVNALKLLGGISPFCALLGYLTPSLIDEYSAGQPKRAGRAYAINVLGCILGPLVSCYILLPSLSERHALILLALPFVAFWLTSYRAPSLKIRVAFGAALAIALGWSVFVTEDFEAYLTKYWKNVIIRRDYAASVISTGDVRENKTLIVNGVGMTTMTPITKFIAHLPMAYHTGTPKTVLVICFGMGTTFRSALTWDTDTTVVELVPSVANAFSYYHADAAEVAKNPKGHIVIDDGRRFLNRTDQKFDIIVVDPPPPVEAAGSSLLFSTEFYELAKKHLNPGGIVQMWFPGGPRDVTQAVLRSMVSAFPYVRVFGSVEIWGAHLIGSMQPLYHLDAKQLISRMPQAAQRDLMEWTTNSDPAAYMSIVTTNEYSVPASLNPDKSIAVTDDQPYNEYFLLRSLKQN